MFEKLAIVDLTRNYPGTDLDVLGRLRKLGPTYGIGQSQLAVVARQDQNYLRQQVGSVWRWIEVLPGGALAAVSSVLSELAAAASEQEVLIVSYGGDVLRLGL